MGNRVNFTKKSAISLAVSAAVIASIGGGVYYWLHRQKNPLDEVPPAKTVEQILNDRKVHASQQLATPQGALFAQRNWDEFARNYQPEKDFNQLAELIRSTFIGNGFSAYQPADHERLMELVLKSLSQLKSKDIPVSTPLIFQAERLPSPRDQSSNYHLLEKWITDSHVHSLLKKLALTKIVVNAESPAAKWVNQLASGITGNRFQVDFEEWMQMIAETRNVKVRHQLMKRVASAYSQLPVQHRPSALILLSSDADLAPDVVRAASLKFLHSTHQKEYESALRAVGELSRKNLLTTDDKDRIRKLLIQAPAELNTPYVVMKTKEILNAI
jgi:hypothetical protein